jgi:trehalose utilization protein
MAKFKPKEPRVDYRLPVKESLSADLEIVARIRTKVNKKVGDGTKISVTEMLLEEAEELRDTSFAEWSGKPADEAAEDELVDRLVKVYEETGSISLAAAETKKKSGAVR